MITIWPKEWDGFKEGRWSTTSVNVRDFIKKNYTPYDGDESFLAGPTEATKKLWENPRYNSFHYISPHLRISNCSSCGTFKHFMIWRNTPKGISSGSFQNFLKVVELPTVVCCLSCSRLLMCRSSMYFLHVALNKSVFIGHLFQP